MIKFLLIWFLLSVPVALLAGRFIKVGRGGPDGEEPQEPTETEDHRR